MKKHKKICVIIFLFFSILLLGGCNHMKLKGKAKVTFIACGSADIALLEYQNHYGLIDTGENTCRESVISYLEENNIEKFDFMILTHPDKDHIGNAVEILKRWNVDAIYMTDYQKNSSIEKELFEYIKNNNIHYEILKNAKKIKMEELEFMIEAPKENYDSSNNSSLVVTMNADNIHFFFGADIKKKRVEEILNRDIDKATIVKLPYHGRYISNMKQLLEKLNPEFVIITSDIKDEKTENLLNKLNINYTYTEENVMIITDGEVWERK